MAANIPKNAIGLVAILDMKSFSNSVKLFDKSVQGMSAGIQQTAKNTKGAGSVISTALSNIASVAMGMITAQLFNKLARGVTELVKAALPLPVVSSAFESLGGNLKALHDGTLGLITDIELMKKYNMAVQLVGEDFGKRLPEALGLLTKVAASTGESMEYMFDSIIRGVARVSPRFLDNLGVMIKLEDAYASYSVVLGKNAEDLTAKVFFQALNHIPRYVHRGAPFSSWLYRIAHNLVANWHRDRSRRQVVSLDRLATVGADGDDSPLQQAANSELRRSLLAAMRHLSGDRQQLLILKFAERLPNAEIGEIMGRSEGAIKSLYHRTLVALREDLSDGQCD